jgi:DNA-binding response OmpR family regulator
MTQLVVLAEDDENLGQLVKTKLEHAALRVIWKKNGSDAWDTIVAEKPALAILDADMPVMDGFEVLRRIKASTDVGKTPVIMVSAMGHEAYVGNAMRGGASDFIIKPFKTADLLERVQQVLKGP